MNLCSDGHDEVCYEGRRCPVCEKMDEIAKLEGEVDDLKAENRTLNDNIDSLQKELGEIERG